jgi:flagellar motor switch protein FliN
MSEAVAYEQLDHNTAPAGTIGVPPTTETNADLRRLSEVPMELSVEIGRTRMTVGETLQLRAGSIVTLERLAGEPVDLLVNGTPLARGEVVIVDEEFGLRITEIVEDDPAAATLGESEGAGDSGGQINAGEDGGDPVNTGVGGNPIHLDPTAQE